MSEIKNKAQAIVDECNLIEGLKRQLESLEKCKKDSDYKEIAIKYSSSSSSHGERITTLDQKLDRDCVKEMIDVAISHVKKLIESKNL